MKLSRFLPTALNIVVTFILLVLILRSVDVAQIRGALSHMDLGRLAMLLVLSWFGQLFCAQRWRLFAASLGIHSSYRTCFQMYFVGMLFNVGLPSLVGGDVVKAFLIARVAGSQFRYGLASVVADRAAGLITLIAYGSAALFFSPASWRGIPVWAFYLVIWVGIVAAFWMVRKGDRLYRSHLAHEAPSVFRKGFNLLADFHQALGRMRLSGWASTQVVVISFFNSALALWIFHQVTVAAGYRVSAVAFSALLPLITLLTMLPVSLGGVGIREWAYIEALALLNVPRDIALAIALTSSALILVSDLAGALLLPTIPGELRAKAISRRQSIDD